jgi:hypothetical protein
MFVHVGVGAGVGAVRGRAATVGARVGVGGDGGALVEPDHFVLLFWFGLVIEFGSVIVWLSVGEKAGWLAP